ncbi:VOC family protein [Embleya hyalina]|uniref:Iron-dependent extradiol dioxygenase n=1 Tax=Embleya hyalina TaxID=516124 RepID=A0A401YEH2_9ACTN|nr:VOC family protein [Embleya hyalina]GCD93004.1 iron-dependent extradiol dioxygenase [Embleya hyalina]
MPGVKELAYVVYEASDLADWEHFAVDLLGMQLAGKDDDLLRLRTDAKVHRWLVRRGPADDLVASGYAVEDEAALDALADRLAAAGVPVADGGASLAATRGVDRILVTTDPIGNRVELVSGLADADTAFHSDRLLGGFVTGEGGAGHQVLIAKGVPREDYLAFYQGLLGFRISDTIVEEVAPGVVADLIFLHCNPRHHSVAFGDMPHPASTHHFMLEVADIRDVGTAHDRCLEAGQPFEMTLGMHPNDHMFSFYVRTPSGFSVEYGWGGLLIDDATWRVRTLDRLNNWGHLPPEVVADRLARAAGTDHGDHR